VRAHYDHYNYYPEIKSALETWAKRLDQIICEDEESKVVRLYA